MKLIKEKLTKITTFKNSSLIVCNKNSENVKSMQ